MLIVWCAMLDLQPEQDFCLDFRFVSLCLTSSPDLLLQGLGIDRTFIILVQIDYGTYSFTSGNRRDAMLASRLRHTVI